MKKHFTVGILSCLFMSAVLWIATTLPTQAQPTTNDLLLRTIDRVRIEVETPSSSQQPLGEEVRATGLTVADLHQAVREVLAYNKSDLKVDPKAPYTLALLVEATGGEGERLKDAVAVSVRVCVVTGTQKDFGRYKKQWLRTLVWESGGVEIVEKKNLRSYILSSVRMQIRKLDAINK